MCLTAFVMLAFACSKQQDKPAQTQNSITIRDYYGRDVTIARNPRRIVSLSPGITELLFDLKEQQRLVGRTDFCLYPAEAKNIPSVGGISDASLELICSLRPELVITASMVSKQRLSFLFIDYFGNDYPHFIFVDCVTSIKLFIDNLPDVFKGIKNLLDVLILAISAVLLTAFRGIKDLLRDEKFSKLTDVNFQAKILNSDEDWR